MIENEKNEQVRRFLQLCEDSSFPHREDVLKGVRSGEYSFEGCSSSPVPSEQLIGTYGIKAKSAARYNSTHARRLVSDTLDFLDELKGLDGEQINFWHFCVSESSQYLLFEGVKSERILGCIFTVARTKVSEDEWERLWDSE